jgi:competence protein ComEC
MFDKAFRKAPFIRAGIPLAGGIIMARQFIMPAGIIFWVTGFFVLLTLGMIMVTYRSARPVHPLTGSRNGLQAVMLQVVFFCMGGLMGSEDEPASIPETMLQARICDEIEAGDRSLKTMLDRVFYLSGETWIHLDGRVQVYFEPEDRCRELIPGDCITALGRLLKYEDPLNPFEFDYGAYQRGKGVCCHLYLTRDSWLPSRAYTGRGLQIRSKQIRHTLMERIDRNIEGPDERAILHALLLGYRAELGQDVKQQFIRSGSMHILAVSGLHVGILYILPAFLLGKIRGSVTGRLMTTLVLLALLWSYALLTGLSPSVVRAVTMCSVHRLAILMGRKAGIFHVLSLTAFIMILSRPAILFETGFQLSFAAVAGIAGFQKPLFMLLPVKGWLARRIWQLVTVSLAAQLSTAPLSLYYFHQFSYVFMLSSLAVIPLVTVILYVGLAFILLSAIGLYPLSGVLEWLATLLGGITHLMGLIPGAFSENITLIPIQVAALYLLVILSFLYYRSRRVILLHALMVALALLLLVSLIREYRVRSHEGFYVFSIPRESAIGFVRGRTHSLYRGGSIRGDSLIIPYALRNFSARQQLASPDFLSLPASGSPGGGGLRSGMEYCRIDTGGVQLLFTLFRDRRIVILRQMPGHLTEMAPGLETDILVLVDNARCNLDFLNRVFKPGLIIVDGSSRPRYHDELERACMRHGIPFHSTEKAGFYVY